MKAQWLIFFPLWQSFSSGTALSAGLKLLQLRGCVQGVQQYRTKNIVTGAHCSAVMKFATLKFAELKLVVLKVAVISI